MRERAPTETRIRSTDDRIGVVVITRDRCDELRRTLDILVALPGPPTEIVVVDNASQDGTAEMVRTRHPRVSLVSLTSNAGAAGRDVGVRAVGTEVVAFFDDDSWPEPGALARAAEILRDHRDVAVVAAHVLVGVDEVPDPVCRMMADSPLPTSAHLPGRAVAGFVAGASIVRTEAFLDAGGFSASPEVGGEEEVLALALIDAGWTLLYAPDVIVHHHPSPRRDREGRARQDVRARIRTAWLRRRARVAVRVTLDEIRRAPGSRARLAVLVDCVRLVPSLRDRRPVRRRTEHLLELR